MGQNMAIAYSDEEEFLDDEQLEDASSSDEDAQPESSDEYFSECRSSDNSSINMRAVSRSYALPSLSLLSLNKPNVPDEINAILDKLVEKLCNTSYKRFTSHLAFYQNRAYDLLRCSITTKREEVALAIIDSFADSDSRILGRDPEYCPDNSPLHVAVELGSIKVIKKLLEKNANLNLKNFYGSVTPIKFALLRNQHDLVALFVNHLAQMSPTDLPLESDIKPLHYACMGTNLEHIRHFLDLNPADVNLPIDQTSGEELSGYTPLHLAAEFGNKKTVDFLLDRGAQLETKARQSKTPLHVATDFLKYFRRKLGTDKLSEQADIVKSLLDHGSDVNAKNEIGATPLFSLLTSSLAFLEGDTVNYYLHPDNLAGLEDYLKMLQRDHDPFRIAQILLDHGAKTDRILHELVHAPYWGNYEKKLIKFLQSRGCDVDEKLRRKTPLLTLVTSYGLLLIDSGKRAKEDMMRFLLSCGASTECTYTERLLTPLHWAVRCKYTRVVELLLNHGANPNVFNSKRRTPLHLSSANYNSANYSINRKLINRGADINANDIFNKTPLMYTSPSFIHYNLIIGDSDAVLDFAKLLIKYQEIDYYVRPNNLQALRTFESYWPSADTYRQSCKEEIKRLKSVQIDPYTSLYGVLHKTPNLLARKSNNERFKEIVETFTFDQNDRFQPNEYQIYGPVIKFLYERGAKRLKRLQEAGRSMCELIEFDIPEVCCEEIFSNLGDAYLDNVKNSLKYLKKKEN